VTLNDNELRNGSYFAFFFTEFGSFEANYVKVVEKRWRYSPKNMLFDNSMICGDSIRNYREKVR